MQSKPIYISDTLHNTIQLSILEKKIISTQLFNRLHNISQNSTAYLTFPTNRTKRFEHSIGTMKLCGEIFYYSISNASNDILEDFFSNLKQNIKQEFIEKDFSMYRKLIPDEKLDTLEDYSNYTIDNCFYNICVPKNIQNENSFLYLVIFQAIRIAALLHDIGHPPFSHITENSIRQVLSEIEKETNLNPRKKLFLDIMKKYKKEDLQVKEKNEKENYKLHEQLGYIMAERVLENIIKEDTNSNSNIIYFNILTIQLSLYILSEKNSFFKQIHSIVSGAIDGDRLDYASRDVINSGFESGRIEYSRLISSMVLCKYKNDFIFCPDIKVLNTVEDFFFRRWKLYKYIVYHHRVIKTDHLLQDSIYKMIKEYLNNDDIEIESEKDDLRIPNDISGLWKPLKLTNSNQRYFDALIQWDDGWLMSILKQYYFSANQKDKELKYKLEELLSNKKQFYSIIKGENEFKKLDKKIIDNIHVNFEKVKKFGDGLDKSFNDIIGLIENICTGKDNIRNGYFLFRIKLLIESFFKDSYNFEDLILEMVKDYIENKCQDIIEAYFIEFKTPNYGLSKTPYIHSNREVTLLSEISNIDELLEYDGNTFPVFYMYIKKKGKEFKNEDFIDGLGVAIAKEWNNFFASIS